LLVLLSAVTIRAATFDVGPDRPYPTPSEVPWESLNAGDTVRIHWRADAYQDKWVICRQGTTDQPIVVQGVPGPAGEMPVIRYNWIESGNRQLDLVDAEDSAALRQDPRYRSTFVYGNVLIEPDGAGNSQIVHYGGDSGNLPTYRQGTLYFHHNTVVSTRTGNTTLFRLSTNDESADCRNNVLFVTASGNRFALLAESGTLAVTHNWAKPGSVISHAGGSFTGSAADDTTWISGTDPGFVDLALQNFRLSDSSACLDTGTEPHPATLPGHHVDQHYLKHRRSEPRRVRGLPDLGAYEFSPFAAWRGFHFGPDAENELISGADADPDGDQLLNLIEYAFELDPHQPSRDGLPRPVWVLVDDLQFFGVEFRRRPIPSDLTYATAVSVDSSDWQPGCEYSDVGAITSTEAASDASDPAWIRVRLIEPIAPAAQRQIRVTVWPEKADGKRSCLRSAMS
jgi:hypothetical protein